MNKPTYEELERALIITATAASAATGGEDSLTEPALAFLNGLTYDDTKKTVEVINAVHPKFFTVEVSE